MENHREIKFLEETLVFSRLFRGIMLFGGTN